MNHRDYIEHFYEYPLKLEHTIIYPDFKFIHPITKKEIYWEHFGMMDDSLYSNKCIRKIELYK